MNIIMIIPHRPAGVSRAPAGGASSREEVHPMFDAVLDRAAVPRRRLGAGALLSVIVHATAVAGAIWLSAQPADPDTEDLDVVLYQAMLPPTPPPAPRAAKAQATPAQPTKPKPRQSPDTVYDTTTPPKNPEPSHTEQATQ